MPPPKINPETFLTNATIAPEIFALQPTYRALILIATNIPPTPSPTAQTNPSTVLSTAESLAKTTLQTTPLAQNKHITAWRNAYKSFGAKPKKTKPSLEALLSRLQKDGSLPRINPLTDLYNAVSIKHNLPIGGEDLDLYVGAPRLIRGTGAETFVTKAGGEEVVEAVPVGEVVWCDDEGVTCRCWNWRQGTRTSLGAGTVNAVFILDALEGSEEGGLEAAGEELAGLIQGLGEGVGVWKRVIGGS